MLHLHKNKYDIEQDMNFINRETILVQESLTLNKFKRHTNAMMRYAYHLDTMLHLSKEKPTYLIVKYLKDYIKQLQHPKLNYKHEISYKTYSNIKNIYQCLGKLSEILNI